MKNINKHPEFISLKSVISRAILTLLTFSVFIGCKKDETPMQAQQNVQAQSEDQSTAKWGLPNIVVHKGQSIQAAVNKAKAGMVILIEPGTYAEAIVVKNPV